MITWINFKRFVYALWVICAAIGLGHIRSCVKGSGTSKGGLPVASHPTLLLPKSDKEEVLYDSDNHTLTVLTSSGTELSYVRNPVIHIQKDGVIKVEKKQYGFELSPFIGIGYSNRLNTYVGLNLLDVWKFDAGVALAYSPGSTRPLLAVGYNVWRDTNIAVGIDTTKTPHVLLSVHF